MAATRAQRLRDLREDMRRFGLSEEQIAAELSVNRLHYESNADLDEARQIAKEEATTTASSWTWRQWL